MKLLPKSIRVPSSPLCLIHPVDGRSGNKRNRQETNSYPHDVEFNLSGQGYSSGPKISTEMKINPRTGVNEYWVPVSASEFSSDGPVEIEATVYGKDGGVRDKSWLIEDTFGSDYGLDCRIETSRSRHDYYCNVTSNGLFDETMIYSNIIYHDAGDHWWNGIVKTIEYADSNNLTFHYDTVWDSKPELDYRPEPGDAFIITRGFGLDPVVINVNPNGTLPQPIAYVDVNGNDETGLVNTPNNPYLSVTHALKGIRNWMNANGYGNHVSGSMVKLNPGTHNQPGDAFWGNFDAKNEWVTITSNASVQACHALSTQVQPLD